MRRILSMGTKIRKPVFIIGHKNPDTDSICSAIAYAALKRELTKDEYIPKRAGVLNNETKYVLERFGLESPDFIGDVGTQIRDITIKQTPGVNCEISLKMAWTLMRDMSEATMPVIEDGKLEGIISIKDIATANMDIYENKILSLSHTRYKNILETIDGTMVVGDETAYIKKGKILVAAANPDLLENYIEEGDLLVTANRFEAHLCAIEMNAGCVVVCMGAPVSKTIQKLATEKGCYIISTPHDTYTVARLISQSTPIRYFMKKDNLITFKLDHYVNDIKSTLVNMRHRDFPVLDNNNQYCGMLSRRSLINMDKKKIILVDHNEKAQAVDGIDDAEILEIIDHHRLGSLETVSPVYFRNQPLGCTATIIYLMYQEFNIEIDEKMAGILCSAIISDTLLFRSPTCTKEDEDAAKELANIAGIDMHTHAEEMFHAGSSLKDKTPEEIFYQDFKKFTSGKVNFGSGQISSMDVSELEDFKPALITFMETACQVQGMDMLFFMLTDIVTESSDLLFAGEHAKELIEKAFDKKAEQNSIMLEGMVSRKKQLIPKLIEALQR